MKAIQSAGLVILFIVGFLTFGYFKRWESTLVIFEQGWGSVIAGIGLIIGIAAILNTIMAFSTRGILLAVAFLMFMFGFGLDEWGIVTAFRCLFISLLAIVVLFCEILSHFVDRRVLAFTLYVAIIGSIASFVASTDGQKPAKTNIPRVHLSDRGKECWWEYVAIVRAPSSSVLGEYSCREVIGEFYGTERQAKSDGVKYQIEEAYEKSEDCGLGWYVDDFANIRRKE